MIDMCLCFVDYEKAFDRVDWRIGVDWRDRSLIAMSDCIWVKEQLSELRENYLVAASLEGSSTRAFFVSITV